MTRNMAKAILYGQVETNIMEAMQMTNDKGKDK